MSSSDPKKGEKEGEYSTMSDSKFGGKENTTSMSDSSFDGKANQDKKAQEHHRNLSQQRVKDGKVNMKQATAGSGDKGKGPEKKTKRRRRNSAVAGALNIKRNAQTAAAMGSAFTAINPIKDAIHYAVIGIAVLADIFTIVPLLGSAIAIIFMLATWILYGMHGHFKRSPEKKILVMLMCYGVELIFSTAPTFIISALANYWLALADRKVKENNQSVEAS